MKINRKTATPPPNPQPPKKPMNNPVMTSSNINDTRTFCRSRVDIKVAKYECFNFVHDLTYRVCQTNSYFNIFFLNGRCFCYDQRC